MTKRALISVYNKDKLVEFAEELTNKYNYEIIATGSTYDLLKENHIKAKEITEITGTRQLINGKVKTLYPDVFAGILADLNNPIEILEIWNQAIILSLRWNFLRDTKMSASPILSA